MPKPVFFLRVKTQFGNLGDALINRELIRLLASHGQLVINLAGAPPTFRAWIDDGIPASAIRTATVGYWLRLIWALLRRPIGGADCWVVLNPGGYVGEVGRIAMVGKLLGAFRLQLLRCFGCNTMLVGVSYERLGPRLLRSLRAQSRALDVHAPRDSRTAAYCDANEIPYTNALPDLAFALPRLSRNEQTETRALASFRQQPGLDPVGALRDLVPAGFGLDFAWQVASDSSYQTRLCEEWIGMGNRTSILGLDLSIESARQAYGRYDIVYSNRLHVLLLAMSAGAYAVPVLAPGQGEKIRGVFADLGLEARIVDAGGTVAKTDPSIDKTIDSEGYQKAQRALIDGLAEALGVT
ncbi:MAG TPA: polysaccharide pyruvyl transferase family protein [Paracoccaceae bacterium]|nr:polysaccharide pyruvyl transferase family protein [Paracoccaceae bacterium]